MRRPKPFAVERQPALTAPPQFASEALNPPTPHRVEQEVQRELLAQPTLRFASLVVRRIDNGVCLQGVVEADEEHPDVCRIAQRIAGVQNVLNRLVVTPRRELPVKG
jgi:osmotically-inducible protein OsmY